MSKRRWAVLAVFLAAIAPAQAQDVPDSELIEMARGACEGGGFDGLIEYFVMNDAVRAPFLAPKIEIRSFAQPSKLIRTIESAAYRGEFSIAMIDYSWVDAKTADNPAKAVKLKVDWKALPDGGYRVDYIRAQYDDQGEGDSPGNLVRTIGKPGAYIFERRGKCWQLTQDLR